MTAPPGTTSHHEYLEAIYEMAEEGIPTVQVRLAQWMGVSAGAVSQAVKKLPTRSTRSRRGKKALSVATNPTIATIKKARVTSGVLPAEIVRQNWNLF